MMQILYMAIGALLCGLGVIAGGLADRIRHIRTVTTAPQIQTARPPKWPRHDATADASRVAWSATPDISPTKARDKEMAAEVVSALVASGYKKTQASEAAWNCTAAERTTIEDWTRAALRRCAKGASA